MRQRHAPDTRETRNIRQKQKRYHQKQKQQRWKQEQKGWRRPEARLWVLHISPRHVGVSPFRAFLVTGPSWLPVGRASRHLPRASACGPCSVARDNRNTRVARPMPVVPSSLYSIPKQLTIIFSSLVFSPTCTLPGIYVGRYVRQQRSMHTGFWSKASPVLCSKRR